MKAEGLEVAGIEFVEDRQGRRYTYDINGTTNYNSGVGREVGIDGMRALARYLRQSSQGDVGASPYAPSAVRAA
jgi:hypothetical protein